jgi:hypothetical protein
VSEQLIAKLVITAAGLAVFLSGVRIDSALLRWIGIALVAVAFLLRFLGPRTKPGKPDAE